MLYKFKQQSLVQQKNLWWNNEVIQQLNNTSLR